MSRVIVNGVELEDVEVIINSDDLSKVGGGVKNADGTAPPPTGGGPGEGTGGGTH